MGLLGTEGSKTIHLVDFGMAKQYIDNVSQRHIRPRSNKPMLGTACYMSCNAHFSYELSRRDDLEALGYMFLYFLKGTVPWAASLQSNLPESTPMMQLQKIGSLKQASTPEDLFKDFPDEFAKYLKYLNHRRFNLSAHIYSISFSYARNLEFEETPDYKTYRSSFQELFCTLGFKDDCVFDWDTLINKS